jgi:hypothetical protein
MRNAIILGTGRSGTSMVAATFRSSGAFMGDQLIPASTSNPHGYYEDRQINELNNDLIRKIIGYNFLGWKIRRMFFPPAHMFHQALWLAAPRRLRDIQLTGDLVSRIRSFAEREPFCYKDPRFSVTLPTWSPYLSGNTRFIVVFRDPMRMVDSMMRDTREQYDPPLPIPANWGWTCWKRTYSRLLEWSERSENWMIVRYDGMFDEKSRSRLSEFVDASLDFSQINPRVSRTSSHEWPDTPIARTCRSLYEQLCERAFR